jgi:sugar O-acyltransferase (sialic acid O-acetyltransferase NeuD family)
VRPKTQFDGDLVPEKTLQIVLFGVRSPLVVDYEETCRRAGIEIVAGVNLGGTPRSVGIAKIVTPDALVAGPGAPFVVCAFGPVRRRELTVLAVSRGLRIAEALVDPTAIIAASARIGKGTFVNAGVVIGGASLIGQNVVVNRAANLGHHTMLGDFVSIGPGATLAGNVHVGEGSVVGAGSVIQPDIRIGRDAVVAAGSVVRRHVPDAATVAGNPATPRRYDARRGGLNPRGGE